MSQLATLSEVQGPEPWTTGDGKTFHTYTLIGEGLPGPVKVNRMPSSPVLAAGQQVWLEDLQPHPRFQGSFKAKVGKDPGQFGGGQQQQMNGTAHAPSKGDFHPGTQSAIKSAVTYAAAFQNPPDAGTVIEVAKQFFAAMEEMERRA